MRLTLVPAALTAVYTGFVASTAFAQVALDVVSANSNRIFLYEDDDSLFASPVLDTTLTTNLDHPAYLTLSPSNELFVTNRGPSSGGSGSIARFVCVNGVPIPNGTLDDNDSVPGFDFDRPHSLAFRGDELFVVNSNHNDILRFTFDAGGNASSSGRITAGLCCSRPRGIAFRPSNGDLFVSEANTTSLQLNQYSFDESGTAILVREFGSPGANDHGIAFAPWDEMFVAEAGTNSVARFLFDESGIPVSNGRILSQPEAPFVTPVDITFSPWGEMFVSNENTTALSRWLFDASFNAVPNGTSPLPSGSGGLRFDSGHCVLSDVGLSEDRMTAAHFRSAPNPTNTGTSLDFVLSRLDKVSLDIFDVSGKRIRSLIAGEAMTAGRHSVSWNGQDSRGERVSIGIYVARLSLRQSVSSTKLTVSR